MPLNERTLIEWVTVAERTCKAKTILAYKSAIRSFAVDHQQPVEQMHNMHLLARVIKGVSNSEVRAPTRTRLPVSNGVLLLLQPYFVVSIGMTLPQAFDAVLMWAVFTAAHWLLLRVGEYTPKAFDREAYPRLQHITFSSKRFALMLFNTKTCSGSVSVHGTATGGVTCAVTAMHTYLQLRSLWFNNSMHAEAPLFMNSSGLAVSRSHVAAQLSSSLASAGFDAQLFSSHSFRRGGATTLAAAGVAASTIKTMGRWTSYCYQLYVETSVEQIEAAVVSAVRNNTVFGSFNVSNLINSDWESELFDSSNSVA